MKAAFGHAALLASAAGANKDGRERRGDIYLSSYPTFPITKQLMQAIPIPQPSIQAVPKKKLARFACRARRWDRDSVARGSTRLVASLDHNS